ncbi:MAG: hypothetical protein ACYDC2_05250 [Solirubrobacteraceae bacterium]
MSVRYRYLVEQQPSLPDRDAEIAGEPLGGAALARGDGATACAVIVRACP